MLVSALIPEDLVETTSRFKFQTCVIEKGNFVRQEFREERENLNRDRYRYKRFPRAAKRISDWILCEEILWAKFRTREPLRDNWPLINGRGAIEFPPTFSLRVHKSKGYDLVVFHPKIKLFSRKMKSCLGNHRYTYSPSPLLILEKNE